MATVRTFPTKKIRPLSKTYSNGELISPTAALRGTKEGRYLVVDNAESRNHILNAATRLNLKVVSRKHGTKYHIHRLPKTPPAVVEYPM